jgi:hypothetical protein
MLAPAARAADDGVDSGPDVGQKIAPLKVFDATGQNQGKEVDYPQLRADKPTVYLFIPADKFDRPIGRFLRELDKHVTDLGRDTYIVAVWLTDDIDTSKRYLPRAQQSIKLQSTALTVYLGEKTGPPDGWIINPDAHVTAIIAKDAKVVAKFGYVSVNETITPKIAAAVDKAAKGE